MRVLDLAGDHLQSESSYSSTPVNISITAMGEVMEEGVVEYEIEGDLPQDTPEDRIMPVKDSVVVSSESAVGGVIHDRFCEVVDGIELSVGEIDSVHLAPVVSAENTRDDFSFYTLDECDARFFIGVKQTEVSDEVRQELGTAVASRMSEVDSGISVKDISSLVVWFSDNHECQLSSVRGYANTEDLSSYYDIDSIREYAEHIGESSEEVERIIEQDSWEAWFKLGGERPTGDELQAVCERVMWDAINMDLTSSFEYRVEAEIIQFGAQAAEESGYGRAAESAETGYVRYYLNIPVWNDEIGVSEMTVGE